MVDHHCDRWYMGSEGPMDRRREYFDISMSSYITRCLRSVKITVQLIKPSEPPFLSTLRLPLHLSIYINVSSNRDSAIGFESKNATYELQDYGWAVILRVLHPQEDFLHFPESERFVEARDIYVGRDNTCHTTCNVRLHIHARYARSILLHDHDSSIWRV